MISHCQPERCQLYSYCCLYTSPNAKGPDFCDTLYDMQNAIGIFLGSDDMTVSVKPRPHQQQCRSNSVECYKSTVDSTKPNVVSILLPFLATMSNEISSFRQSRNKLNVFNFVERTEISRKTRSTSKSNVVSTLLLVWTGFNTEIAESTWLPSLIDLIIRSRNSRFGHVARLGKDTPAHLTLQRQIDISLGRLPDRTWKRLPILPRT